MSASQRTKGHNWEREVARRFREIMPDVEVRRGQQGWGGEQGADVEVPGFWVECKVGKLTNPRAALKQADEDRLAAGERGVGRRPLAVCKDDRKPPFVMLSLEDFLDLVAEWWDWRRGMERR